jgi:hypothetical protein
LATTQTPPPLLYKYRSLTGEARTHVQQLFGQCSLFFAAPPTFNDPFDCRVLRLRFPDSPDQYRKFLAQRALKTIPGMNRAQRRTTAFNSVKQLRPHRDKELQESIVADLQRKIDQFGVFSLCEHPDDILMWSHYGASHTGLCLEFSSEQLPLAPEPVAYAPEFPVISFTDSAKSQTAILLTKAAHWSYEKEWRILADKSGLVPFNPISLSGVVFGCRMPETDRRSVKQWIDAGKSRPRLYEAVISDQGYSVAVRPLDEDRSPAGLAAGT